MFTFVPCWGSVLVLGLVIASSLFLFFFFFQAEDGIRDLIVTGVQTCALPISLQKTRNPITTTNLVVRWCRGATTGGRGPYTLFKIAANRSAHRRGCGGALGDRKSVV